MNPSAPVTSAVFVIGISKPIMSVLYGSKIRSASSNRRLALRRKHILGLSALGTSSYSIHDPRLIGFGKAGEHGERKNSFGSLFAQREIAMPASEIAVRLLQMQRNRIMNPRADILFREFGLHCFALLHLDDMEVIYSLRPGRLVWSNDIRLHRAKQFSVTACQLAPALVPGRHVLQLDASHPA